MRISAKHTSDPRLDAADARLERIAALALEGGTADAARFAALIAARDPLVTAEQQAALDRAAGRQRALAAELLAFVSDVEPLIAANMAGDLQAARHLTQAADAIERANLAEAG
ncbi:hypothetical protein SAMN05192580_3010 [Sphingomonas jatrophae]|uniref:Uncharacterized protein n=1 Tax=Sphingomonas jatrophae TaxID=1166337 RepID=A0A1I6LN91_9SPHN|nr:hypothetical protein SAMN05192580_3010 [Sphingomonas jatrophae]